MIRRIILFSLAVVLCGCATKTITSHQLDVRVAKHAHETVNWLDYMGTSDGFHYIQHSYTLGSRTYRIPADQMHISDPFQFTRDSSASRPLKRHTEVWPPGLLPAFEMPLGTEQKPYEK